MNLLFLDIDGVLNDHTRTQSGYCGIQADKALILNRILHFNPGLQIVISSAWRYLIINGQMTLKGFEYLLLSHGVKCYGLLHGHTVADEKIPHCNEGNPSDWDVEEWNRAGLWWRSAQILAYVEEHKPDKWVVLDDLELDVPHLVRTDGKKGIEEWCAVAIASELAG